MFLERKSVAVAIKQFDFRTHQSNHDRTGMSSSIRDRTNRTQLPPSRMLTWFLKIAVLAYSFHRQHATICVVGDSRFQVRGHEITILKSPNHLHGGSYAVFSSGLTRCSVITSVRMFEDLVVSFRRGAKGEKKAVNSGR